MKCAAEVDVKHRGNAWTTVHVCGRRERHIKGHKCRTCGYHWQRQHRSATCRAKKKLLRPSPESK